jgi:hypothetical protein
MTLREKLKYGALGLFFLTLILLYAFELDWFERTIGFPLLAKLSLLAGLLVGLAWGHVYAREEFGLTEKVQVYVYFCAMCMVFAPLAASLSNRWLAFRPVRMVTVDYVSQEARYASRVGLLKGEDPKPTDYYLSFYYQQEIRTIDSSKPFPAALERGDEMQLRMRTGLWGFEVVQRPAIP